MNVVSSCLVSMSCLLLAATAQADYLPSTKAAEEALRLSAGAVQARSELEAQIIRSQGLADGREEWTLSAEAAYRRIRETPNDSHPEGAVGISRPLRLPYRAQADRKLAQSMIDLNKAQLGETLHENGRSLLNLWFEWLAKYSQQQLWQAQVALAEQQLGTVNARIRLGEAARAEQVNAEAALYQIRLQQQLSTLQERQTRRNLITNFPTLAITADLPLPAPEPPEGDAEAYASRVLLHNHELLRERNRAATLQAEADQYASRTSIDPSVGLFYKNEANNNEHVFGVNLVLTLPGSARRTDQQAALRLAASAHQHVLLLEKRVSNEARSLFESATLHVNTWQQAEKASQALNEAARLSERAYSMGEGSLDQVLTNRRLAIEGQLNAQQARVAALATLTRLKLDAHLLWSLDHDDPLDESNKR